MIVAYTRSRRPHQKFGNDVDDDVRENIISYDDEGGGEDDMTAYDLTPLRIPIDPTGAVLGKDKPGVIKDMRQRQCMSFCDQHFESINDNMFLQLIPIEMSAN